MSMERVSCAWCDEHFDIDPEAAAFGYVCPHCKEEMTLAAIRNPNKDPKAFQIHTQISLAIGANLHQFTAAYIYTPKNGKPSIATGTLVNVLGKRLVATAGHAIINRDVSRIGFVAKLPNLAPVAVPIVRGEGLDLETGEPDVGFLELAEAADTSAVWLDTLPLDRVGDLLTGDDTRPARVFGFPSAWIRPDHTVEANLVCAISLGSHPIAPQYWDSIKSEARNPDPNRDVVLSFDRDAKWEAYSINPRLSIASEAPPEPFGMSGGGVWQMPVWNENALWFPHELKMFGIQSTWPTQGRFLKAVQSVYWIKLVADSYPELRSDLETLYPRIKEL